MKFDSSKNGLEAMFKPYQAALLERIWALNEGEGFTSGEAYNHLSDSGVKMKGTGRAPSRASVIFFLNDMVEEGVLGYYEKPGKGGYHRVYNPVMNKEQFGRHVYSTLTGKLRAMFPWLRETVIDLENIERGGAGAVSR
jgi:hypothetical protein